MKMAAKWISTARQRASKRYAEVHADLRLSVLKMEIGSKPIRKLALSTEFKQRATRDAAEQA